MSGQAYFTMRQLRYVDCILERSFIVYEFDFEKLSVPDQRSFRRAKGRLRDEFKRKRKLIAIEYQGRPRWIQVPTDAMKFDG